MTELERLVVDRFRENGDFLFASLPDWSNTQIDVGADNRIAGNWIKEDGTLAPDTMRIRAPRRYHHRLTLSVDRILEAHTLLGQERIGDNLVVGAEIIADRKTDGPVFYVKGMRKYYDQIGHTHACVMKSNGGHLIKNRYRMRRTDIAEVRKARREYDMYVGDGINWDGDDVVRDPHPGDHALDGARFSHVLRVYYDCCMALALVREPVEIPVYAKRMKCGRWMLASYRRLPFAISDFVKSEGKSSAAGGTDESPFVDAPELDGFSM